MEPSKRRSRIVVEELDDPRSAPPVPPPAGAGAAAGAAAAAAAGAAAGAGSGAGGTASPHTPRTARRRGSRRASAAHQLGLRSGTGRSSRSSLGFGRQMVADLRRTAPPGFEHEDTPGSQLEALRLHSDESLVHAGCVNAAAWNAAGTLLCTGSDDRRAKIWNSGADFALTDGGSIKTGHCQNIFCVSFVAAASDRQVLSCGADGQLRLSDVTAGSEAEHGKLLCEGDGMMFMFEWMPRVPVVLTAQEDGIINRVDLREPRPEVFLSGSHNAVKALAFGHHSEHIVATGGEGACVKLYDVRRLSTSGRRAADSRPVCTFHPIQLASADEAPDAADPLVRMLRMAQRSTETISISGLKFSGDGRELLVSYHGDQVYTFDTWDLSKDAVIPHTFGGHVNYDTFLKTVTYFGPNDEYVMSGSDSGHIFIWEHETERLLRVIDADEDACNGIVPHPQLPMFASYGIDSDCKIWAPFRGEKDSECEALQQARASIDLDIEDTLEHNIVAVNSSAVPYRSAPWRYGGISEHLVFDRDQFLENCRKSRARDPVGIDPYPRYPVDLRGDAAELMGEQAEGVDAVPAWAAAIESIVKQGLSGPVELAARQYEKAEAYILERARRTRIHGEWRAECRVALRNKAAARQAAEAHTAAKAGKDESAAAQSDESEEGLKGSAGAQAGAPSPPPIVANDSRAGRKRQRTSTSGAADEDTEVTEGPNIDVPAVELVSDRSMEEAEDDDDQGGSGDEPQRAHQRPDEGTVDDGSSSDNEGSGSGSDDSDDESIPGDSSMMWDMQDGIESDPDEDDEERQLRALFAQQISDARTADEESAGLAPDHGHILLLRSQRVRQIIVDQAITAEQAGAENEIADGDIVEREKAWFKQTPESIRLQRPQDKPVEPEPAPDDPTTAEAFHVGDPVLIHGLPKASDHLNGRVGTVQAAAVQTAGASRSVLYDVFAFAYTSPYTCNAAVDREDCMFNPENLSLLVGGDNDEAGKIDHERRVLNGEKGHEQRWPDEVARFIDRSRTLGKVHRGRNDAGLLPCRPSLATKAALNKEGWAASVVLGHACDVDTSSTESCKVARARLQGDTLVALLRQREYALLYQAVLTLLECVDASSALYERMAHDGGCESDGDSE